MPDDASAVDVPKPEPACEKCGGDHPMMAPSKRPVERGPRSASARAIAEQFRQLCDIDGNPPRLVAGKQLRCRLAACLTFEIDVGERVPISVAHDEAPSIQLGVGLVDRPGRREAVLGLLDRHDKTGLTAAWRQRSKE